MPATAGLCLVYCVRTASVRRRVDEQSGCCLRRADGRQMVGQSGSARPRIGGNSWRSCDCSGRQRGSAQGGAGNSVKAIREPGLFRRFGSAVRCPGGQAVFDGAVFTAKGEGQRKNGGGLAGRGRIVLTRPLQQQKRWIALERVDNALECVRIDRCCWQNGRDHCGNAAGMVRANVLAASTRRRAAMGKCIEIDHVLHAGKMVPRRWDGGSGKSGGGHSKGWSPFLLSEGQELFQI